MTIGLKTPGADADDVQAAIDALVAVDTSGNPDFTGTVTMSGTLDITGTCTQLAAKAPLASPTFTGVPKLPTYTLGTLPAVGTGGGVIYCSDANSNAGAIAFSNGTNWIDPSTGTTVA